MDRIIKIIILFSPVFLYSQEESGFFSKSNLSKNIVNNTIEKKTTSKDTIKIIENDSLKNHDSIPRDKKIQFLDAPTNTGKISSRYSNNRYHPVTKEWKAHKGTDFPAPYGSPIKATAGGIVIDENYTSNNGNYVKIKHDDVYTTQYLHMSEILVRKGQIIKQGDIIGSVGSSGLATGPHVCYRFWKNGVQIDPFKLENDFKKENKETKTEEKTSETKEFKEFISGFFKN